MSSITFYLWHLGSYNVKEFILKYLFHRYYSNTFCFYIQLLPFISSSMITPTPFLVPVLSEYIFLLPSTISFAFFISIHLATWIQGLFFSSFSTFLVYSPLILVIVQLSTWLFLLYKLYKFLAPRCMFNPKFSTLWCLYPVHVTFVG